jgi:hypothetical protein
MTLAAALGKLPTLSLNAPLVVIFEAIKDMKGF